MLPIREAAKYTGLHAQTLRKYEKDGKLEPQYTEANHRRYTKEQLDGLIKNKPEGKKIIYCRVSSKKQEEDLQRQIEYMQERYLGFEVISDIGSGINFQRPGFKTILEHAYYGTLDTLAVSYKDRLSRISFEIVEQIVKLGKGKIIVDNYRDESPDEEYVNDLIEIITVYSAKLHGRRNYRPK